MGRYSARLLGWALLAGVCAVLALSACRDTSNKTRRVLEAFQIVPGSPQVDTGKPQVLQDNTRDTNDFAIQTQRLCDTYQQTASRKVDILWVVDSSGSMA